uniref:glycosyltransferase n=1 Tax=Methylobacterium sp. B34 TaxID=95563 RepID=UPI0009FF2BE1|nr:glycosyltransferase [Methylobacterium sp. B34]
MTIPRLLHYVWLGGQPLPTRFERNINAWRKLNGKFDLVCWNEKNMESSGPFVEAAIREKAWAKLSDLIRLEAISKHGGVYLDTDIQLVRPLDPFLNNRCFVGYQNVYDSDDPFCNAVIGAEARHPFLAAVLEKFPRDSNIRINQIGTGPELISAMLLAYGAPKISSDVITINSVTLYPRRYFYPYHWTEDFSPTCIVPDTFAIHHWDMSWHDQEKPLPIRVLKALIKRNPAIYRKLRKFARKTISKDGAGR